MVLAPIISATQVTQRRLSFYIAMSLASVLAPGIVVVIASILLIEWIKRPTSPLLFFAQFKGYAGASVLLITLAFTAAGYVFGYISRELAFKGLGQLEKISRVRERVEGDVNKRLETYFPQELIKRCRQAHVGLSRPSKEKKKLIR
jgi:hypothetical protein